MFEFVFSVVWLVQRGGIGGALDTEARHSNAEEASMLLSSSISAETPVSCIKDASYACSETLYFANLLLNDDNVFASQFALIRILVK